jgi:hypothetical protein
MSSFPGSPRLLKGAIVGVDPFNPLASVVVFQYNPDTMTRRLEPRAVAAEGAAVPPPAAPTKTRKIETIDEFLKRGRKIETLPAVDPMKPKVERTPVNPKSPAPAPEGFEDLFESGDVGVRKASQRGKRGPKDAEGDIHGREKDKTVAGNVAPKYAEVLQKSEIIIDIMKRAGGEKGIFSEPIPKDAVPEYKVPHPDCPADRKPRIDRLVRNDGEIIELKPNHLKRQGDLEAQQYAEWVDKHSPLSGGKKWRWKTITYDQARLLAYLKNIGFFE